MSSTDAIGNGSRIGFNVLVEYPWARQVDQRWMLSIRVQPSSGNTAVVGALGSELKIRIAAPADKGKANAELCRFLASKLGVHRHDVTITQGDRSRNKVVQIVGVATLDPIAPS